MQTADHSGFAVHLNISSILIYLLQQRHSEKMLRSFYIPAMLAIATLAMGYPSGGVPKPWEDDDGIQEIQILKRDAVLTASDLELAERHGVDVNEGMASLKHASCFMGVTNVCQSSSTPSSSVPMATT